MNEVKKLREQQARLATEARTKFDEIDETTEESRAAEIEQEFDRIMAEHDRIEARISRMERLAAAERAIDAPDPRRPKGDAEGRGVDGGEGPSYREAFHEYLRAQGQLGDMPAECRSVLQGGFAKVESRAQTVGTNSAGGFTVPEELQSILIRSMLAWGPMYDEALATVLTTRTGASMPMPTVNDTAVTAGAHTEGATLTDDGGKDVTFGQRQLDAFAFDTEWVRVSKELADDSVFAMEQLLGDLLGERLGRIANLQLTTGSGSSAPHGIVTASSAGTAAASSSAITADEIITFLHDVDPAYRMGPKVRFMFHDTTLEAIRKLKDGQGNYLWQMGNVQAGTPGTLLGYPYSINQAMATLSDGVNSRVMLFGDFGKYYVRKVGAPLIGALQDKDFWPGFGVAGYIRFDGELGDTAAVKHLPLAAA